MITDEQERELRADLAVARRINARRDEIIGMLLSTLDAIESAAKDTLWEGRNTLHISALRDLLLTAPSDAKRWWMLADPEHRGKEPTR